MSSTKFSTTSNYRSPLNKNTMTGHLHKHLPVNEVNKKGQFFRASAGKKPQVPKTARQAAALPGDMSRGKRSSMPQAKTRPDSPVPSLQGPCDRSLKSEVPAVPASTGDEALFQCTKPSGVPRGPSHLQFPWLLRATMRSPLRSPAQVEGTQGFLPQPEKDLERPSSTRLEARFPYQDSRAMTRSPSPLAWRPDFPGAPREAH